MNKLFTKVAALTLGVAMAAGVGVAVGASQKASSVYADNEYELVKNVSSLSASDKVVIANAVSGNVYTISTTQNNNNRSANGTFTVTNDKITVDSSTQVFTLGKDGDNFTFLTDSGYIYAASSSSNYLRTKTALDDNGKWSVSIANTGAATVVAQGTNTRNILKFNANNGNPIFAAYNTAGTVAIFKSTTPVGTQYSVTDSVENGSVVPSTVSEGATLTATITPDAGYKVPETVSVTMGGVAATHTYQNGVVTVENVTGDIVITGTCAALPTPTHAGTSDDPYTVADAILAIDASVTGTKYVTGVVNEIVTPYDSGYKNITFNFVDNTTDTAFIQAFRCGGTEAANVAIGDTVVVSGSLLKYGSKYELDSGCQIVSRVSPQVDTKYTVTFNSNGGTDPEAKEVGEGLVFTFPSAGTKDGNVFKGWTNDGGAHYYQENDTSAPVNADTTYTGEWQTKGTETDPYNVARARLAITYNAGVRGVYTTGIVKEIVTPYSTEFKNITFNIVDAAEDTDYLQVFRCKGDDASKVAVGDIVVVSGNLKLHDSTPEYDANCVLQSLVTPVTDWTDAQKAVFTAQLDGYVPPYFAELSGDIEVSGTLVQYNVKSDVVAAFNSYYEQQGWESEVAGYWSHETTGGNGVVQAYAQTSATGALLSFQYTEYAVVTLDENGTKTEVKLVPPVEYTLPSPTASLIPDGKEFKAWEIAGVEYQPEAKVSVSEDVTITAVYVDKVQTDWTDAQKAALETALHGYLPPFFGELAEDMTTTENSAVFTVSGDHTAEFASKLGDGWNLVSDNNYMKIEDSYYLTASIYKYGVRLPVGDYSEFTFTYHEGQPAPTNWSDEMLEAFETYLHGVVPTYDDSVKTLAYVSQYGDFEMPGTTEDVANANLATLCQGQGWEEENGRFYKDAEDGMGYVTGYVYNNSGSYEVTLKFVQTRYSQAMKDQFAAKMHGNIPPFLMFSDFEWVEADALFASIQYTSASNLTQFQNALTNGGFTLVTQENTSRYVTVAQDYLDGVLYQYAASLQDGGVLVFEVFVYANYALFTNIGYKAQPLSISVSGEYKDVYEYGEEFDPTGIVINAVMSDETVVDVTESAQFNGFDSTVAGVQTITVVVGNVQTTFDVTINEKPAPAYDADAFAKDLLEMVAPICANYDGKKNNKAALKTVWDTMSQRYSTLSNEEKAKVIAAAAKADGTDLEKAMAFYNYACKKYGLTKFIEGRQVKALVAEHETGNSILPIVVIVASSVAAITAIGVVIALKRRKALLAK